MLNLGKKEIPTKDELYIRDIIVEYLKNPKVTKEYTPTTGIYFLSNHDENIFIMLTNSTIQINSPNFFYNKSFSMTFMDGIKKKVDIHIEQSKDDFRKRTFQSEINLLRGIFKDVQVEKSKFIDYKPVDIETQIKELVSLIKQ